MSLFAATTDILDHIETSMGIASDIEDKFKVKTVDLFNDQINRLIAGQEFPFEFNCVLLEVSDVQWSDQGLKNQQGETIFRFHCGLNVLDDGEKVNYTEFLNEIHKVLQGFNGEMFNALTRIRTAYDGNHGNVNIHVVEYKCKVWDNIAENVDVTQINDVGLDTQNGTKPPETFDSPYTIP